MVEPNLNSSPRHFLFRRFFPSFNDSPEAMKQFQFFIIHKPPPPQTQIDEDSFGFVAVLLKQHQQIFFIEC